MKEVIPRSRADSEIDTAILYYLRESKDVASNFLYEVEKGFGRVGMMPGIGSLRFAEELHVDGLRAYPLQNFPYLLFYFEREDHIDLIRVLHTHRDVFDLSIGV